MDHFIFFIFLAFIVFSNAHLIARKNVLSSRKSGLCG